MVKTILCAGLALFLSACGGGSRPAPATPGALQIIEVAGQSNAGQGGAGVTLETAQRFATIEQFSNGGKAGLGTIPEPLSKLVGFEAASDGPGGQYVATMLGFALGNRGGEYLMRTDWYGGQPLQSFVPGTINFANTMQAMTAAKSVAAKSVTAGIVRAVECPWYVWIQGESGPYDHDIYAQQLGSYIDNIRPAIAAATGQASPPTFVVVQTNTPDWTGWPSTDSTAQDQVGLAQWDVSRSKAGVIMAGPMYQAPMIIDANDNIHANSLGRMVVGDMLADVISVGAGWKPLQPRAVTRRGAVIDITFDVPAGAIAWDTRWIAPAPNYGFGFHDDAASATIAQVEIVARDTVRITLSAVPTGANPSVGYAQGAADGLLDGWAAGRGQLMSPTTHPSYFWTLGYPVPQFVNHYSVKFRLPV